MFFRVYHSIHKIEKEWRSLVDTPAANVYRTYEFFELLYKLRILNPFSYRKGNWRCCFVVGYEDGAAVAIAPLIFDRTPREVFRMLGHNSGIGNTDFIYREEKFGRELLAYIKENVLQGHPLELWRVDESSFLVKEMKLNYIRPAMKVEVSDFDSYYHSLSKNARKNIKKAYNHLAKDGVNWKLETYCGCSPEVKRIIHRVVTTYYTRMMKWRKKNKFYSLLRRFYMASTDIIFASLFKISSARLHVMYIGGEIAFFLIGYECGNVFYFPHAAMNEKYARYSPGILTFLELIKERSSKGSFTFDLGSGDEFYKKELGCKEYSLYMLTTEHTVPL